MSKTIKIEIEIPAPPEGWGEVEWRHVASGDDESVFFNGIRWVPARAFSTDRKVPVARKLKPLWTPPPQWHAMFGDCWLSRDKHGNVRVHKTSPELFHEYGIWESNDSEFYLLPFRPEMMPPANIPWEKCCFKIGDPRE